MSNKFWDKFDKFREEKKKEKDAKASKDKKDSSADTEKGDKKTNYGSSYGSGFYRGGRNWGYDDDYYDNWDMGGGGRTGQSFTRSSQSTFYGSGRSYGSSYFGDFGNTEKKALIKKAFDMAMNFAKAIAPHKKVTIQATADKDESSDIRGLQMRLNTSIFDDSKKEQTEQMDTFIGESIHESSHLLYTDDDEIPSPSLPFDRLLTNIIEDERVESELSKEFPGYVNYLEKFKKYFFEEFLPINEGAIMGKNNSNQDEARQVVKAIINALRYPSQLQKEELNKYRPILDGMKKIMADFPQSTKDSKEKAEELQKLIESHYKDIAKDMMPDAMKSDRMQHMMQQMGAGKGQKLDWNKLTDEQKKQIINQMLREISEQMKEMKGEPQKGEGEGQKGESGEGQPSDEKEGEESDQDSDGEGSPSEQEGGSKPSKMSPPQMGQPQKSDTEKGQPKDGEGEGNPSGNHTPSTRPNAGRGKAKELSDEEYSDIENQAEMRKDLMEAIMNMFGNKWEEIAKQLNKRVDGGAIKNSTKQLEDSNNFRDVKFNREMEIEYGGRIKGEFDDTGFFKMKDNESRYNNFRSTISRYSSALAKILQFRTVDKKLINKSTRSGVLDTNKLAEAVQGVPNVYERYGHAKSDKISVAILIDQSGSMGGVKIERATEAAILFAEALKKNVSIELFIYGHWGDCRGEVVSINIYKEPNFDRKFSLGSTSTAGNNADGYAIYEVAKRVRQFSSRPCVMFVISDGQPANSKYSGQSGVEHTRQMVTKVTKEENMQVVQIAIEPGIESAKMFDHYVTLTDLEKLPFELSKVLKKVVDKMMKVEIQHY